MNTKFDEQNQSIRSLIRDVNKKINKDLNFNRSPGTNRNKNTRKSVEKCTGSSSTRKYAEYKKFDLQVIKGNNYYIYI